MPQLLDQHYWAHHLQLAGASTEPVKRHDASPEPLARALRQCVTDPELIARAQRLGQRQRRDGLGRTVALLERLAQTQRLSP